MLFVGLRFNLSPGDGGADRNRLVDRSPGSDIAALWCCLRWSCIAVIRRRLSVTLFRDIFLLHAFRSATIYLWVLTRYKSLYRVVKVYGDMVRGDFSPD